MPSAPIENDFVLTCAEVAATLRLSGEGVRKLCRRNILPAIQVGRLWRIRKDFLDVLEARRIDALSAAYGGV